jgi:CheY-like chemotaxis protein/tetratricopeptide (TPR) repeat protein
MAKETVLVADADPRSLRLVGMALRRAGFTVVPAATGGEAMRALAGARPQAMMLDGALPAPDGLAVCRAARAEERLAEVVIIVLGTDAGPAARAQAVEAGADDYLVRPILLKEIVQRVQHLLERRRFSDPGVPAGLTGSLRDFGLLDVFQWIETWKKSAVVRCERSGQLARVWVRDGQVIDAELGPLGGDAAFWRLMTWESGEFRVDFSGAAREQRIQGGTQAALMESMRRLDELSRMAQEIPLESQLAVDVARLEARLADLPDDLNGIVRSFDGVRTLRAAIDLCPADDLAAMAAVGRLMKEGILRPVSRPASLQQWVSAPPLPVAAEPSVPRIVNFPAIRGMRRARLRREMEQARARIASGEPLRLHHVVALPARSDSDSLGDLRRISPAAGEAAKAFAPDVQIARLGAVEASEAPPIAPVVATTPPPELGPSLSALARQRWKWLVAAAAAVTLGWVLRPQPRTERQDSPWLAGIATAAAGPGESVDGYTDAVARGNDLFRQGKYAAAAAEYRKALAVRPQSAPVLVALGDAYLESDRPRSAIEPLESAARLDPGSARAQLLLGTAYHSLGRKAEASKAYRRFLELEPASGFAKDVKVILAHLGG